MVVLLGLTVKNIRGEEFQIEVDRDADVLGLKVQIWESQHVPVDRMRLIFAGKELTDASTLTNSGVQDGATIFLVEGSQQPEPVAAVIPQEPYYEPPQQAPFAVSVSQPAINSSVRMGYHPLDTETAAAERMNAVYDLARWIRYYCLGFAFLWMLAIRGSLWALIPVLMHISGWSGTRKLKCCGMCGLMVYLVIMALVFTIGPIIGAVCHHPGVLVFLIFGFLHWAIFSCVVKFKKKLKRLSDEEVAAVRARIVARGVLF